MNLLYICNWSINDGISASIWPSIDFFLSQQEVQATHLVTLERNDEIVTAKHFKDDRLQHHPISCSAGRGLWQRIQQLRTIHQTIKQIASTNSIDLVVARCSPAGEYARFLHEHMGLLFIVESFEPHADYMLEGGTWSAWDPRYLYLRWSEKQQVKHALQIITVSSAYAAHLGPDVVSIPCTVDLEQFQFDALVRQKIRAQLSWHKDDIVGVYLGQFGDIYYDEEALDWFRWTAEHIGHRFKLLLIHPKPKEFEPVVDKLGFNTRIMRVAHQEVAQYLSAADFAYCPVRPSPSRRFCSAIKVGEYLANGLPIIITPDCGDDSDLIAQHDAGAVVQAQNQDAFLQALVQVLPNIGQVRQENASVQLAKKYRSRDLVHKVYSKVWNKL